MTDGSPTTEATPPPDRQRRGPLVALAVVATVLVVGIVAFAACAPASPPGSPTPTSAAAAPTTGPVPSGTGPVITSFQIIDDVSCSGSPVSVPVSWSTRNARTVQFEVDRQPLASVPDSPLSGIGNVSLPCDGREHEVVLVASGADGRVSLARQVNTAAAPPPPSAPSIVRFDVLDDVTCGGGTVAVPAAWLTQNAQAVNFSVDGQPLSAAAGFSTSGVGNVAVPCDGQAHKVTLTATGTGPAASLSRSVNTSDSGGGTPTSSPTVLSGVTEAPTQPTG